MILMLFPCHVIIAKNKWNTSEYTAADIDKLPDDDETQVFTDVIIDPGKRIIVNDFEHEDVNIYGFKDEVPVIIYGGKCVIDFNEISSYISFLI